MCLPKPSKEEAESLRKEDLIIAIRQLHEFVDNWQD